MPQHLCSKRRGLIGPKALVLMVAGRQFKLPWRAGGSIRGFVIEYRRVSIEAWGPQELPDMPRLWPLAQPIGARGAVQTSSRPKQKARLDGRAGLA